MDRNEKISAMLDGELDESASKAVLSAMDGAQVQTWKEYCVVGDLIRSSEMVFSHSPTLLSRIEQKIDHEPTVIAPTLATKRLLPQRVFLTARFLIFFVAIIFMSVVLNQAIPPLDAQVQMVRTQAVASTIKEQDLVNNIQSDFSEILPIPPADTAGHPLIYTSERVITDHMDMADWMNIWEPTEHRTDHTVLFTYVSSPR